MNKLSRGDLEGISRDYKALGRKMKELGVQDIFIKLFTVESWCQKGELGTGGKFLANCCKMKGLH